MGLLDPPDKVGHVLPRGKQRRAGESAPDRSGPVWPRAATLMWLDQITDEGRHVVRLHHDLPFFAEQALKLRPKMGPLEPFRFNGAQHKLHELLEEQRKKTGRVRAIVLKARQLGVSTYVAARFYRATTASPGLKTIIIGHERRASSNLFQIVKRLHDGLPNDLRPSVGTSNAEEL